MGTNDSPQPTVFEECTSSRPVEIHDPMLEEIARQLLEQDKVFDAAMRELDTGASCARGLIADELTILTDLASESSVRTTDSTPVLGLIRC